MKHMIYSNFVPAHMKKQVIRTLHIIICFFFCSQFFLQPKITARAAEPVVIVIDPGHGGENLGTDFLPIPEKDYNMKVANYMKESLEQYDDVIVYLTHTTDIDMSLEERAVFAESVNADFLYSLHFNQSADHTLYGAEVWIPSSGMLYSQGYSAAFEFIKEFQSMGLFNRGIKTRVGKQDTDYYGIIRNCAVRNIPAIIVEHCHVDHAYDITYLQSEESLKEFGVRNAAAVARYFGLTSKVNNVDYSVYAPQAVPVPVSRVYQDATPPEYTAIALQKYNKSNNTATFTVTAKDNESYLQYYSYSIDGGLTWSIYTPWTPLVDLMTVEVKILPGKNTSVLFKVLNQYDRSTVSAPITIL